jgi:hypothetical protein
VRRAAVTTIVTALGRDPHQDNPSQPAGPGPGNRAPRAKSGMPIEVEVETLDQLHEASTGEIVLSTTCRPT